MNKFELLREAVQTYKVNHCDGDKNEKTLIEFIDELEQLTIPDVSESSLRDKLKSVLKDIEKMDLEGEWYGFMHDKDNAGLVTNLWNYCR